MQTKTYTVMEPGFLFGDHYPKGAKIELNEKQARRFVDEGRIALPKAEEPKKAPAPAKTDTKD
ncbi:hypothetical protein SAMN06297251_102136 [Fulvimarina manganoxydans]|uniref:Uncharacterized protein n=1 Tax=Fulvimarina manganoxydans TaxID=937218 RepID=A0A1W1Z3M2_9HYPH|nr:hypothetical protein [Fulvimarina manganoxydans]SMC43087.1 hypothetical protein SAMN06297251_102136 [Fulvimarina manganoxydans]